MGDALLSKTNLSSERHHVVDNETSGNNIIYFTREWRRPSGSLTGVSVTSQRQEEEPSQSVLLEQQPSTPASHHHHHRHQPHPCLVCGILPPTPKRCSRCHAAIYCSTSCQRIDFLEGKHKVNCKLVGELREEKSTLETQLWGEGGMDKNNYGVSTFNSSSNCNQFRRNKKEKEGREEEEPQKKCQLQRQLARVGHFWVDGSNRTCLEKQTTAYCVCLLKLVKLLGRGESWRLKKIKYYCQHSSNHKDDGVQRTTGSQKNGTSSVGRNSNQLALHLALDLALDLLYLDRSDMRVRLVIPSIYIELDMLQEAYDYIKFWLLPSTTCMILELTQGVITIDEAMKLPYLHLHNQDMSEQAETWMDFDAVYTGVGMVFELALIKFKMFNRLRGKHNTKEVLCGEVPPETQSRMEAKELERHVRLLLSVVHNCNPHLLPCFSTYDPMQCDHPAAVDKLLNTRPPGFDLQYRMGNPGGRSYDEAVAIWQRDMVIWDNDQEAMAFLARFCSNLDENALDLKPFRQIGDEDGTKREEAEALAARLQVEHPNMTADEIMMHPDMVMLMMKHLTTGSEDEKEDSEKYPG